MLPRLRAGLRCSGLKSRSEQSWAHLHCEPATSSTSLALPITFTTGSYSVPKSGYYPGSKEGHIPTRRASEGCGAFPSLAHRVNMQQHAELPCRGNRLHLAGQGHRQRHEARDVHVLGRFDHPVLKNDIPVVPSRVPVMAIVGGRAHADDDLGRFSIMGSAEMAQVPSRRRRFASLPINRSCPGKRVICNARSPHCARRGCASGLAPESVTLAGFSNGLRSLRRMHPNREGLPNPSGACQLRRLERRSRDAIGPPFPCKMQGHEISPRLSSGEQFLHDTLGNQPA